MNRQVCETVPPGKKISLWTPWGVQRVPDLDKTSDRTRLRLKRRDEEHQRDRSRKEAEPPGR